MLWGILLLLPVALEALQQGLKEKSSKRAPNIIFIIADDVGWNDVSFHGSTNIGTPNIDALTKDGVVFNQYYTAPVCAPTRASLFTGRHYVHHGYFGPDTPNNINLNLSYSGLPQYLKSCCNYTTHTLGKWHLGMSRKDYLPTSRGFDSHFGYWNVLQEHKHHIFLQGYDFNDNNNVSLNTFGTFTDTAVGERALDIIRTKTVEDPDRPFYLQVAFENVHWPIQAPDHYMTQCLSLDLGGSISRHIICAMTKQIDDIVGKISSLLTELSLWENTLVVFTSDNGGDPIPNKEKDYVYSFNYPLRGGKDTLWQGGMRVPLVMKGAGLQKTNYVNENKFYVTDFLPTFVSMALESMNDATKSKNWMDYKPTSNPDFALGDGINQWKTVSEGVNSERDFILIETHPVGSTTDDERSPRGDGLIVNDWKIVNMVDSDANDRQDGWFIPPGENANTTTYTERCTAQSQSTWRNGYAQPEKTCVNEWCLFNIRDDPCEYNNVAGQYPEIVQELLARLEKDFQPTAVKNVSVFECMPVLVDVPIPIGSVSLSAIDAILASDGSKKSEENLSMKVWRPCDLLDPYPEL
jgi:arylsulfatase B